MTDEFGPSDDDPASGLAYRMGGWWLSVVCAAVSIPASDRLRFDPQADRLSIHGESESTGSAYEAGQLSVLFPMVSIAVFLFILMVVAELLGVTVGTVFELPALVLSVAGFISTAPTVGGLLQRMNGMEVYDHRTEPTPDMDDLTQQYVDGEIDTDQLEAKTEARLE